MRNDTQQTHTQISDFYLHQYEMGGRSRDEGKDAGIQGQKREKKKKKRRGWR